MARNNSVVSELYSSCRNNDITRVKELITTLTLDDIDRIEQNGSTALHVASYYGHTEIVRLLLERGASRSIRNSYGYTPEAESRTPEIKKLFLRNNETDRYVCHNGSIEWMKADENIHMEAQKWRWIMEHSWEGQKLDWLVHEVQTDFIDTEFKESKDLEKIQKFFNQAIKEMNPICLIKAYTAETDFYKHLNKQLAIIGGNFKSTNGHANRCGMKCYLQIFFTHHDLDRLTYIGECYRGMIVVQDDLDQYEVGSQIMNKSFLSTSSDYSVAMKFALKSDAKNQQKYSAICTYKIQTERSALSIMEISEYPNEKEVLVMPYTAFRVKSIRTNSTNESNQPNFSIDLEESMPAGKQVDQDQKINTTKPLTFRKKLVRKFNKWLGEES
ncbi:unnamed protein product [Rotaria sp. Silwood2]|nr:unnamed protein product [Rotaria sp. Silwood2]CAF2520739.1 unnamed protein product [Rotaria sp. Silwood2]CAF2921502.1 unnamed protein product [Rotaria sp. Silwood2]CAF3317851.1 unnamed protein product [Rotaria sp. Silwood2]CAF3854838.1 unnamed protein product [Rotaria sp. Silwood2]